MADPQTWTYDATNLSTMPVTSAALKDQVRFLVGDTNGGDKQLDDYEILFSIGQRSSIYGAAAMCCLNLAAAFARKADSTQGPLHTAYSQQSRNYASMAARYENQAASRGAVQGFSGGISESDKRQREQDNDRVPPEFARGMTDNFLPVAPAGNETETGAQDESQNL